MDGNDQSMLPESLKHLDRERPGDDSLRGKLACFSPDGEYYYTNLDRFSLLDRFVEGARGSNKVGYINALDTIYEAEQARPNVAMRTLLRQRFAGAPKIVALDGLTCTLTPTVHDSDMQDVFRELADMASDHILHGNPESFPERIVFPVFLYADRNDTHGHMCVGALEFDKERKKFTMNLFEQYAFRDPKEDGYKDKLVYSGYLRKIEKMVHHAFEHEGFKVDVKINQEKFCRQPGVCSAVALQTAKKLLFSEKSPSAHMADLEVKDGPSDLAMGADDVQRAHAANVRLLNGTARRIDPASMQAPVDARKSR